ncbi:MAG: diguanylate cyclase [Candidatus Omnitrophota bacterium]
MTNKKINSFSLTSKSLKDKLRVAFYLMSVVPLLICVYLASNYIFPRMGFHIDVAVVLLISAAMAIIGFFVIKEIFDRFVSVSAEARLMAGGDVTHESKSTYSDEVGQLMDSLGQLTQRIRSNMDELKNYSEKTTQINIDIQQRVIMVSSLLQISSLISQGAKLEDILQLVAEKSRFLANADVAYLLFRDEGQERFTMKLADGLNRQHLLKVTLEPQEDFFDQNVLSGKPLILDGQNTHSSKIADAIYEKFKFKHTLAMPVYLRGRIKAILGVGSAKNDFVFKKEDTEVLDIFVRQIAIAVENEMLLRRVEKLEIKDTLTGLYNQAFIQNRLEEEIKRAITYQRPCSYILFDIDDFKKFSQEFGLLLAESALKKIGSVIRDSVTEIDRVGRVNEDEFAIVMPEKSKRQAQEIAESIRRRIELIYSEEADANKRIAVSGAVSENPLDGIHALELMNMAKESVGIAKKQGKNRIAGFKERSK